MSKDDKFIDNPYTILNKERQVTAQLNHFEIPEDWKKSKRNQNKQQTPPPNIHLRSYPILINLGNFRTEFNISKEESRALQKQLAPRNLNRKQIRAILANYQEAAREQRKFSNWVRKFADYKTIIPDMESLSIDSTNSDNNNINTPISVTTSNSNNNTTIGSMDYVSESEEIDPSTLNITNKSKSDELNDVENDELNDIEDDDIEMDTSEKDNIPQESLDYDTSNMNDKDDLNDKNQDNEDDDTDIDIDTNQNNNNNSNNSNSSNNDNIDYDALLKAERDRKEFWSWTDEQALWYLKKEQVDPEKIWTTYRNKVISGTLTDDEIKILRPEVCNINLQLIFLYFTNPCVNGLFFFFGNNSRKK